MLFVKFAKSTENTREREREKKSRATHEKCNRKLHHSQHYINQDRGGKKIRSNRKIKGEKRTKSEKERIMKSKNQEVTPFEPKQNNYTT